MTQQEMKEYYKHIEYEQYNDIEIIDLRHEKEDSNRHVHLVFEQNKLYYSGDMGTYVFGENIHDVKNFFKGSEINPYYWSEKVEAASENLIEYDFTEEAVREAVKNDLLDDPDNFQDKEKTMYKDYVQDCIDECFSSWEEDRHNVFDNLCMLYSDLGYGDNADCAESIINDCEDYSSRFIYACNLIQWVENEIL